MAELMASDWQEGSRKWNRVLPGIWSASASTVGISITGKFPPIWSVSHLTRYDMYRYERIWAAQVRWYLLYLKLRQSPVLSINSNLYQLFDFIYEHDSINKIDLFNSSKSVPDSIFWPQGLCNSIIAMILHVSSSQYPLLLLTKESAYLRYFVRSYIGTY